MERLHEKESAKKTCGTKDEEEVLSPVSTTRVDGPSSRPELTGHRFPLPVNTGRVDGRAFPLAELTGRVNSASGNARRVDG